MSDIQNSPTSQQCDLQRQVQQRQILAMMGIGQWIQSSAVSLQIADIEQPTLSPTAKSPVFDSNNQDFANDTALDSPLVSAETSEITNNSSIASTPVETALTVTDLVEPLVGQVTAPVQPISADISKSDNETLDKVVPFDLQGGRYGDWVLIVDIQALSSDSQKLWQNISQALSLNCETTSFPICAGMDTAELANASLAGYIFKIARSEDIKVAALTELPALLSHPNMVSVPHLEAMLADSALKRQLWQQITNQG